MNSSPALLTAHARGIIHRDIKPANILIAADGTAKVSDFGLARQSHDPAVETRTGAVLGTPDYMSPEQRIDASSTDARSDLWSLAATLYQMLSGRLPRVIQLDDMPSAFRKFLSKALQDAPDDRFQTGEEFRAELNGQFASTKKALTSCEIRAFYE